eukprot:2476075-Amphidinium_carterae.1
MMLHELETRKRWVSQVTRVFEAVNKKQDGSLNKEEFMEAMGEVHLFKYATASRREQECSAEPASMCSYVLGITAVKGRGEYAYRGWRL